METNDKARYPIHILNMQMWHYQEVADKWNKEIEKHGPEEHSCRFHAEAKQKIKEFEDAISRLSNSYYLHPINQLKED